MGWREREIQGTQTTYLCLSGVKVLMHNIDLFIKQIPLSTTDPRPSILHVNGRLSLTHTPESRDLMSPTSPYILTLVKGLSSPSSGFSNKHLWIAPYYLRLQNSSPHPGSLPWIRASLLVACLKSPWKHAYLQR